MRIFMDVISRDVLLVVKSNGQYEILLL
ncbi:hypothetical protein CHELA1G2_11526 [Hyphomicrobiales bacterium]|nr:hypothetical protein CHELA1G2_11526 [Hyphomicrobiales bacterium]